MDNATLILSKELIPCILNPLLSLSPESTVFHSFISFHLHRHIVLIHISSFMSPSISLSLSQEVSIVSILFILLLWHLDLSHQHCVLICPLELQLHVLLSPPHCHCLSHRLTFSVTSDIVEHILYLESFFLMVSETLHFCGLSCTSLAILSLCPLLTSLLTPIRILGQP